MSTYKPALIFITGLVVGLSISIIWSPLLLDSCDVRHRMQAAREEKDLVVNESTKAESLRLDGGSVWLESVDEDVWNQSKYKGCVGEKYVARNSTAHLLAEGRERSRALITCWIMTRLVNVNTKLQYVMRTWAADCDHVVLASKDDLLSATRNKPLFDSADILKVNTTRNGREALSDQEQAAWQHVHKKYLSVTDFFIRADDDSHFVMPNLRHFLRRMDPDYPIYYGNIMCEPTHRVLFNAGGPGFVVTRAALKKLVEKIQAKDRCHGPGQGDDWKDGMCLRAAGVLPLDMRDDEGKERFIPHRLKDTLVGKIYDNDGVQKYWTSNNAIQKGMDCCSKKPISILKQQSL